MGNERRWYVSAAAVREYAAICGYDIADGDGPGWDRAERELISATHSANYVGEGSGTQQIYRVTCQCGPRRTRLEFTVSTDKRPEGELPQLVRVRDKGRRGPSRGKGRNKPKP